MQTTKSKIRKKQFKSKLAKSLPELLRFYSKKFQQWSYTIPEIPDDVISRRYLQSAGAIIEHVLRLGAFSEIADDILRDSKHPSIYPDNRSKKFYYRFVWANFLHQMRTGSPCPYDDFYELQYKKLLTLKDDLQDAADMLRKEAERVTPKRDNIKTAHNALKYNPQYKKAKRQIKHKLINCLLYTSPSPRD